MKRIVRTTRQGMLGVLLACVALAPGTGPGAGDPRLDAARNVPAHQRIVGELRAPDSDARLPFLAGSGTLLSGALDLPTRLSGGGQARVTTLRHGVVRNRVRAAATTALRLSSANHDHAAIARALAAARAGPPEARSTPPPISVS